MKSMKIRTPVQYYDYFHIKQQTHNNNLNNNIEFDNYPIKKNFTPLKCRFRINCSFTKKRNI